MNAKKATKQPEPVVEQATMPDGRWFQLRRKNYAEAVLTEVVVRDGEVVSTEVCEDMSRICLGKMMRRVTETYADE